MKLLTIAVVDELILLKDVTICSKCVMSPRSQGEGRTCICVDSIFLSPKG